MKPKDFFHELSTLTTPRLILRQLTLDDAADVYAYARDPMMTRFTSWSPHRSIDDSRAFVAYAVSRYKDGEPMGYGVVESGSGRLIGTCGIENFAEAHERAELAYAIASSHWNKGYATEAAGAVVDHAFRVLPLNRLQSCCHVENTGSARVMEKLGMTFEGILRSYFKFQGRYDDVKYYSLLRNEWESKAAGSRIM